MKVITREEMRALEARSIAAGISEDKLVCTAADGAMRVLGPMMLSRFRRMVVLAGTGNNASDAFRMAADSPIETLVLTSIQADGYHGTPLRFLEAARAAGVEIRFAKQPEGGYLPGDIIVDGLLGIGFNGGDLRPNIAAMAAIANASGVPIVSVDVPSGLDSNTGKAAKDAIAASMTIVLGYPKAGLFSGDGPAHCGRMRFVPIPVPPPETCCFEAYTALDAALKLPKPTFDVHKKSRGRVCVCAGSDLYAGAAVLCCHGAMRAGAGYVKLVGHRIPNLAACIVCTDNLEKAMEDSDVIVAGPGWGPGKSNMLQTILNAGKPTVLDADALNAICEAPDSFSGRADIILTPHYGEAARLAKAFGVTLSGDRMNDSIKLSATLGCVVSLKGHGTVTSHPNGRCVTNTSGDAMLATAGTGDVLSGIIGALMANGMEPFEAATLGVFCHGRAAESCDGIPIADDIPELTGKFMRRLAESGEF
ncbi:MAG: NAD(P)H-hydrate dehydratase [Victivallaceae bacterium]|nr:NAD(P)H-hydrate dehydratase [Victivallaceae bacterium]